MLLLFVQRSVKADQTALHRGQSKPIEFAGETNTAETKVIRKMIEADWSDSATVLRVVASLNNNIKYSLTLRDIQYISMTNNMRDALQIAEYLASERVGLLQAQFELICANGQRELLSDEAVHAALKSDVLLDPSTGKIITDWANKVILTYASRPRSVV